MNKLLKWILVIPGLIVLVSFNFLIAYNLLVSLRAFVVIGSHNEAAAATGALFFAVLVSWVDVKVYKMFF